MLQQCYQLVGLPGVGKTTWAKNQQIIKNHCVVSTDQWIEKIAVETNSNHNEIFEKNITEAIKHMMLMVRIAQREQRNIIWDQTSLTKISRIKKFNALPAYEHIAVVFDVPHKDEHTKRLNRFGKTIPQDVLHQMISSYEEPCIQEGFKQIWYVDTHGNLKI